MRRELEIGARAWGRPFAVAAGSLVLAGAAASVFADLSAYQHSLSYVLALLGAALGLWVSSGLERAAWSRTPAGLDLLLFGNSLLAALVALLVLHVASGTPAETSFGVAGLSGCAQLAALALVFRRAPLAPAPRVVLFLLTATVVPALIPTLRPLLDASRSFQAVHFPGWIPTLTPILTLIVIASALSSNVRVAAPGNSPA